MKFSDIHSTIDFASNGVILFPVANAATIVVGTRVALGYGEVSGVAFYDAGGTAGSLTVEQAPDTTNWTDQVDTFAVLNAGLPFAVKIVGRFVRIRFTDPGGASPGGTLRIHAALRPIFTT